MYSLLTLIVVAVIAVAVGILIGFWLYRRGLKKDPAKVQAIAQEIADAGKKAQAALDQLEAEGKRLAARAETAVKDLAAKR